MDGKRQPAMRFAASITRVFRHSPAKLVADDALLSVSDLEKKPE